MSRRWLDQVIKSNLNHQENIVSNIWAVSEIKSLIINTRNIFLIRESFENSIYFLSKATVLFYQLDSLSIESENRSIFYLKIQSLRWIQYQFVKVSHQKLRHQKSNHYIRNLWSNSNHLFASRIFLQNSNYSSNKLTWIFNICDEINNTSNSNLKSILQIHHIFVQYFDKNSILRSSLCFENITKSHRFHLQRISFLSSQSWIQ